MHISKGRKVRPDDLLPREDLKRRRQESEDDAQGPPSTPSEFFARIREKEDRKLNADFWLYGEGRNLEPLLTEDEGQGYEGDTQNAADFLDAEFEEVTEKE